MFEELPRDLSIHRLPLGDGDIEEANGVSLASR